ncbi:unnamed protein product [Vitrella brassicaformis CCMP3155]|uniref:Uncharacterized protein n=1 Tax=Vitrella brassicaformis (strain CCMP3155) TaxID=1169540 RepID=A0A0G4EDS7_VITBC|nr:unnamed protein product [Vitrella brassicaformis CCMP3155]|eukprot:CEL93528.1 unnamed protein product [Vitrella brassicaformis CCMP3155]
MDEEGASSRVTQQPSDQEHAVLINEHPVASTRTEQDDDDDDFIPAPQRSPFDNSTQRQQGVHPAAASDQHEPPADASVSINIPDSLFPSSEEEPASSSAMGWADLGKDDVGEQGQQDGRGPVLTLPARFWATSGPGSGDLTDEDIFGETTKEGDQFSVLPEPPPLPTGGLMFPPPPMPPSMAAAPSHETSIASQPQINSSSPMDTASYFMRGKDGVRREYKAWMYRGEAAIHYAGKKFPQILDFIRFIDDHTEQGSGAGGGTYTPPSINGYPHHQHQHHPQDQQLPPPDTRSAVVEHGHHHQQQQQPHDMVVPDEGGPLTVVSEGRVGEEVHQPQEDATVVVAPDMHGDDGGDVDEDMDDGCGAELGPEDN